MEQAATPSYLFDCQEKSPPIFRVHRIIIYCGSLDEIRDVAPIPVLRSGEDETAYKCIGKLRVALGESVLSTMFCEAAEQRYQVVSEHFTLAAALEIGVPVADPILPATPIPLCGRGVNSEPDLRHERGLTRTPILAAGELLAFALACLTARSRGRVERYAEDQHDGKRSHHHSISRMTAAPAASVNVCRQPHQPH
jgi:hypothetical protein